MIREPRSAFVGRHRELETLESLLDASSLVTLTGVGGAGKTRLAMRAANRYAEHEGIDCWFVPLESVQDPQRVPLAVVRALPLADQSGARSARGRRRRASRHARDPGPGQLRADHRCRRVVHRRTAARAPATHRARDEPSSARARRRTRLRGAAAVDGGRVGRAIRGGVAPRGPSTCRRRRLRTRSDGGGVRRRAVPIPRWTAARDRTRRDAAADSLDRGARERSVLPVHPPSQRLPQRRRAPAHPAGGGRLELRAVLARAAGTLVRARGVLRPVRPRGRCGGRRLHDRRHRRSTRRTRRAVRRRGGS